MNKQMTHSILVRHVRLASLLLVGGVAIALTLSLGATATDPPVSSQETNELTPEQITDISIGSTLTVGPLIQGSGEDGATATNIVRYVVDVKGESFEVNIENGRVVGATVNGKPLPSARFRMEDTHVVLLDESGEPTKTMQVLLRGLDNEFMFRMMGDHIHNRRADRRFRSLSGSWSAEHTKGVRADFERTMPEPSVMIGMYVQRTDPALAYHLDLAPDQTVTVTGIREDLPAHRAGIREYDVIVGIGAENEPPVSRRNLYGRLQEVAAGETVALTVIQKGQKQQVSVTLEAFDRERLHEATLIGHEMRRGGAFRLPPHLNPGLNATFEGLMIEPGGKVFLNGSLTPSDAIIGAELQLLIGEDLPGVGIMELQEVQVEDVAQEAPPEDETPGSKDDKE